MGETILTDENNLRVESKYARIERERKFLLRELPEPLTRASQHVQIWDNYITNTRLRLRKIRIPETRKYILKLTQKYVPEMGDLSRTIITNTYLSPAEYKVLAIFEGNEIRKNRYPYEYEGHKYKIDVFLGALWGVILAETKFESDEEMEAFKLPPFTLIDVTDEEMFTGGSLVNLTIENVREYLDRRKQTTINNAGSY